MSRPRILFISNLFPNPLQPHRAAFSRQQIVALSELAAIDVIAPVAWTTKGRNEIPASLMFHGIEVFHPIYWYSPGLFRSLYGYFFWASIRSVARKLLSSRKYDFVYASWLYPDGWAAAQLAKEFSLPLFTGVVGTDVNRLRSGTKVTEQSLWVVSRARKIIAVSNALKQHLMGLGVVADKVDVVENGVDRSIFCVLDKQKMRTELNLSEDVQLILFVGNLLRTKGLHELLVAFSLLVSKKWGQNLELVLVGAGPFEKDLRGFLVSHNLEGRVQFLGTVPQAKVAMWMNACDVFCLPSYSEGQPNVVLEAMACGVPVVATRVGGIPDLDRGDGNLRLVEPRSSKVLAEALEQALVANKERVQNSFIQSWGENAQHLMQVLKS